MLERGADPTIMDKVKCFIDVIKGGSVHIYVAHLLHRKGPQPTTLPQCMVMKT